MTTYRWAARSTTSGEHRWTDAAVALLFTEQHTADAAFLETNKDEISQTGTDIFGEFGVTGTAVVDSAPITTGLGYYEQKVYRRSFRRMGHYYQIRVYDTPFNDSVTLPLPGEYFPGETTGPKILADGITTAPVMGKDGPTALRITIVAGAPIYASDSEGDTATYGL